MYFNICQRLTRTCIRQIHTNVLRNLMKDHSDSSFRKNIRSTTFYWAGVGILVVGLSYSAVPLYRMFCQVHDCYSLRINVIINLNCKYYIVEFSPLLFQ